MRASKLLIVCLLDHFIDSYCQNMFICCSLWELITVFLKPVLCGPKIVIEFTAGLPIVFFGILQLCVSVPSICAL